MHKSVSSAPRVVARTSPTNGFMLFFSTSITLHKRRWKAVRSCHSLLLDFTFFFLYFWQWRTKSCRFHLECDRLEWLKKPNVWFCLGCSGGITGLSNLKRELRPFITVPTRCWNCVDFFFFFNVFSSVEKSGSGFRVLGSTGSHWMSIKPTREAVMRRADWRVRTHRLTQLYLYFFQSRPHIPSWKQPILLHTECSHSKILRCTKKQNVGQHRLARLFSQLRHANINLVNLATVTCSQVADGDSSGLFFVQKWSGK